MGETQVAVRIRLAQAAMRKAAPRGDAVVDRTYVAAAIRDDTPRA